MRVDGAGQRYERDVFVVAVVYIHVRVRARARDPSAFPTPLPDGPLYQADCL